MASSNYAKFYEEPKWLKTLNKGKWPEKATKPIFRPGVIQIADDDRKCPGKSINFTE